MTEAEARAALAAFDGVGGLERWIAEQRHWQAAPGGWAVAGELQGWRFRLEAVPGGVRMVASAGGGETAVWFSHHGGRRRKLVVYSFIQSATAEA